MAEQPELQLPMSGTPAADRHQHQQQPDWERGKGQWQQPDQVGGDKAEQAQKREKRIELANRDRACRSLRARAIGLCSLRARDSRNRPRISSKRERRRVVGGWCGHGDLLRRRADVIQRVRDSKIATNELSLNSKRVSLESALRGERRAWDRQSERRRQADKTWAQQRDRDDAKRRQVERDHAREIARLSRPPTTIRAQRPRLGGGLLQAGAGRRVRADRGWLGQALSILVPAIT